VRMKDVDASILRTHRKVAWRDRATRGQPGLTFSKLQGLATEIVDQMVEHWDFKAQLQGSLQNDLRPPTSIEHLFPQRRRDDYRIKRAITSPEEEKKFAEIQQFFSYYETTGCTMTHCSLMGAADMFSSTGKWHFPDTPSVQKQLFEKIAWLFPKKLYMYMSEKQTVRFPFIEDLDVQASADWRRPGVKGEKSPPPDDLIMRFPERDSSGAVTGDPGELMHWRALAIHKIYPQLEYLEVLVYSASGFNKGKDMPKSSFHLVWPQLLVDPDRAPLIRYITLALFQEETMQSGSYLRHLQQRLLQLHESNNWELVFDDTTVNARNGLRLPYSDKASKKIAAEDKIKVEQGKLSKTRAKKITVREDRPSKAVGRIRFEFAKDPESNKDVVSKAQWNADAKSFSIAEWIEMGSCRRDPDCPEKNQITPWQIGPDVRRMLPTRHGGLFTFDHTHQAFPNIRMCRLEPADFRNRFTDALSNECDALEEEGNMQLRDRLPGTWLWVTKRQAVWRSAAVVQFNGKVPDRAWHKDKIRRPAEVIYIKSKGKVIVDGPEVVRDVLVSVLKDFTTEDDNAVNPLYDLTKMSK